MYTYITLLSNGIAVEKLAKVNWEIEDGVLKTWIPTSSGKPRERRYFPLTRIDEIRIADER